MRTALNISKRKIHFDQEAVKNFRNMIGEEDTNMKEIIQKIINFRDDRDWKQFHTPANLAKSISIEAGELLENFQWNDDFDRERVAEELADVITYCILMAESMDLDIKTIINNKLKKNSEKYPIQKSKGNSKKYTEF